MPWRHWETSNCCHLARLRPSERVAVSEAPWYRRRPVGPIYFRPREKPLRAATWPMRMTFSASDCQRETQWQEEHGGILAHNSSQFLVLWQVYLVLCPHILAAQAMIYPSFLLLNYLMSLKHLKNWNSK